MPKRANPWEIVAASVSGPTAESEAALRFCTVKAGATEPTLSSERLVFVRLLSQGPIPLFREYNERLDGDPESEYQLGHKLTDAIAKVEEAGGPSLRLLDPTHDQIPDGDNLEDDPGSLNVPVNNPQRLAAVTQPLTQQYTHPGGRTLHYRGDQWWAWQNAAYTLVEPGRRRRNLPNSRGRVQAGPEG